MKSLAKLTKGVIIVAMTTLIGSAPVLAGTFVYVSNADDGDIRVYSVQTDGSLKPGEHAKAAKVVMPMAVSPDRRFLYAAARSKAVFGFRLCDRPKHGRIEDFIGIPARRELPVHFARQDWSLPIWRVVRL